jgi:hypothetical protein
MVSTLSWSIDVEEVAASMHHNLPTRRRHSTTQVSPSTEPAGVVTG